METNKPYLRHLTSSEDLITSYEDTRAGFVSMALEKARRSTPIVEEARALRATASLAKSPRELLQIPELHLSLLFAAGVSDKAAGHFLPEDEEKAISGLIENYLEPAGTAFIEELVYRFLLTKGDSLGGSLRNIAGIIAQQKMARSILSILNLQGTPYEWLNSDNKNSWVPKDSQGDADIELFMRGIRWTKDGAQRTIIFNLNIPFIGARGNNVDIVLFNQYFNPKQITTIVKMKSAYIAMGELKGGIDPAGADEHWKTARTALRRITEAFTGEGLSIKTQFIGAAIEQSMAKEIWNELESGNLTNAANLTKLPQLMSLVGWLCSL